MKALKGYKTLVFNLLSALLMVAQNYGVDFGLSAEVIGYVAIVGNFILRFLTTTPITKSE